MLCGGRFLVFFQAFSGTIVLKKSNISKYTVQPFHNPDTGRDQLSNEPVTLQSQVCDLLTQIPNLSQNSLRFLSAQTRLVLSSGDSKQHIPTCTHIHT